MDILFDIAIKEGVKKAIKSYYTIKSTDKLFDLINKLTSNIALIQTPNIDKKEFKKLPSHECEYLYFAAGKGNK